MVRVIGKNCQIIENATEEEFETLIERNIPTTKGGKCLKACILETLSMVRKKYESQITIFGTVLYKYINPFPVK